MYSFLNLVLGVGMVSAVLGALVGCVVSVLLAFAGEATESPVRRLTSLWLVTDEATGKRVRILTNLWLVVGGVCATTMASAQAIIVAGAEPEGTLMGMGFAVAPALLVAVPMTVIMSVITLVKQPTGAKLRLLVWFLVVFIAHWASEHQDPGVAANSALAFSFVAVLLPAIWLVQALRS